LTGWKGRKEGKGWNITGESFISFSAYHCSLGLSYKTYHLTNAASLHTTPHHFPSFPSFSYHHRPDSNLLALGWMGIMALRSHDFVITGRAFCSGFPSSLLLSSSLSSYLGIIYVCVYNNLPLLLLCYTIVYMVYCWGIHILSYHLPGSYYWVEREIPRLEFHVYTFTDCTVEHTNGIYHCSYTRYHNMDSH
jgi:hypothetical protein